MGHRDRALIAVLACRVAHADPEAAPDAVPAPTVLEAAQVLPLGVAAPTTGVGATSTAGYVGAPAFDESLTATVGRISVHAGASTLGNLGTWRSELGAAIAVIRSHALDVDVGGGYEPIGWSGVPEAVSRVAIGRAIAGGRVQATAALGLGRDERYGDVDLAANHPVGDGVYAGFDARYRADLARDPDDSPGEREWDAQLDAFAARRFGRFVILASAGAVGWKMRFGTEQTGAVTTLGVAAGF